MKEVGSIISSCLQVSAVCVRQVGAVCVRLYIDHKVRQGCKGDRQIEGPEAINATKPQLVGRLRLTLRASIR